MMNILRVVIELSVSFVWVAAILLVWMDSRNNDSLDT